MQVPQVDLGSLQQCLCTRLGWRMTYNEGRQSQKRGMKDEAGREVQNASVSADAEQSLVTINALGNST
jgi:hypothetical protein